MRDTIRSITRPVLSAGLAAALIGGFLAFGAGAPGAAAASPLQAATPSGGGTQATVAAAAPTADEDWFTSWAQSQDRRSGLTFTNQTFRMITHLSQGGDALRIRIQNQYGSQPITVDAASIALSSSGASTVPGTDRILAFAGLPTVTVPAGGEVWSDSVELQTEAQDDIAVSMFVKEAIVPSLHSSPFRDNYGSEDGSGNQVGDASGAQFSKKLAWTYLVSAVDVHNTELVGTIVPFGSSVVDGEGSQNCGQGCTAMGTNRRWSDELARRINSELPAYAQLAVANAGIGGTTSSPACAGGGNDGVTRLERDVLALHGVTAVIYYYGTNDLPYNCSAATILESYSSVFQRLRDAGIDVYVTPITPRPSYTGPQNAERETVNAFVRAGNNCSGTCDAVFDFDAVLKDPTRPNSIFAPFDTGDGVHANVEGQQAIANSISLPILASSGLAPDDQRTLIRTATRYGFEAGYQGWQAGANVGSLGWVGTFANGPTVPFAGERVLDARSRNVPADAMKTVFIAPPEPLNLSKADELIAHINSHGGLGGASGYEAVVTLTGTDGDVLAETFAITPDQWTTLNLDVADWDARSAVSRIEIGFRGLGVSRVWVPHFQIDEITWNAAAEITSGDPQAATVGTPYSFTVTATGDPVPTFAVSEGELPAGLSLDGETGIISGIPTVAGTAAFTVSASNGAREDATARYEMIVGAAQAAAMITSSDPTAATVGAPYSFTVTATGNPVPTFAVSEGELPASLSLDGETGIISGIPTVAGTAAFTVSASNGVGEDNSVSYALVVEAAPVIPVEPTGPTTPGDPSNPSGGTQPPLAHTGSDPLPFGAAGVLMALIGASLVLRRGIGSRRRESTLRSRVHG